MKGQMEMMGLVIIVILITVGLLFMATFALQEESQKSVFTRKGLASSTLSAVLKTTVTEFCGGARGQPQVGEDILEDCAHYFGEYDLYGDAAYSQFRCSGQHSCVFFKAKVTTLLENTLGHWGKNYELKATLVQGDEQSTEIMTITGKKGCPGERDSSGQFPIQAEGTGLVETQLNVCD